MTGAAGAPEAILALRDTWPKVQAKPEGLMAMQDEQDSQTQEEAVPGQDPRVGDTWESMDPRDEEASGGRRRVGVVSIDGEDVLVENKVTRHQSRVRADRFVPPNWRFVG